MADPGTQLKINANAVLEEAERCIELGQWDAAIAHARTAGLEALDAGRMRIVLKAGDLLERLQDHALAARLLAAAGRMRHPSSLPEWDGSSLEGRTLLIVQRIRHIGAAIRLGQLIPLAARRASGCIVLAERRLVPLYRRSFPGVDVRERELDDNRAYAEADVIASFETLTQHLAPDEAARIAGFSAYRPVLDAVRDFRRKYGQDGRPRVGISWHSTNENKDLPVLEDWAELMRSLSATYVSLQYGQVSADIDKLRVLSGAAVIHDETVDSLTDLDSFAAQIAALDMVITISNTSAHMTGALGVPMYVILDDKNHLIWPAWGRQIGWYPSATLIRKQHRKWIEVFAELGMHLRQEFVS